ncbi:MAG TPA: hypothetical protein VJV03_08285 [Pyrinomonadaceae bacterium]|nr:hypothetical protein [Pyrinomonadaceae bacterium]
MSNRLFRLAILITLVSVFSPAAYAQRRPAPQKPAASDLKITYKQTTSGQAMESTTLIKGPRERSEMRMGEGMNMVNITQCDLRRTIQLSDIARKYVITPMTVTATQSGAASTPAAPTSEPVRRGGVVTYTTTSTDTGERKEMFGFTARHIKTTMVMSSSPDACSQNNFKMELDGWYIDFSYGLQCDLPQAQVPSSPTVPGGCRDRYEFKNIGNAKKGYPLTETMTMFGADGRVVTTTTKEVLEISREPLDAALFDVPAGYTEAATAQELYMPASMSDMTSNSSREEPTVNTPSAVSGSSGKAPGSIRIGVVQIKNKTDKQISTEALRARLINDLQGGNVDAVPLNAMSAIEADAECKAKQCDFILYTDLATLKSSKIGGMFGRVTGVAAASKTEAKLDYKLVAVGETSPRLQASASAKEEGEENSAGTALAQEARAVTGAVRKN